MISGEPKLKIIPEPGNALCDKLKKICTFIFYLP
jgi:hypothetical protein